MSCTEPQERLSAYLDGELEADEVRQLEQHLEQCSFCSQELADLEELTAELHALPSLSAPPQLLAGLKEELARGQSHRQTLDVIEASDSSVSRRTGAEIVPHPIWSILIKGLAAAAVLLLAFQIYFGLAPEESGDAPVAVNQAEDDEQVEENRRDDSTQPKPQSEPETTSSSHTPEKKLGPTADEKHARWDKENLGDAGLLGLNEKRALGEERAERTVAGQPNRAGAPTGTSTRVTGGATAQPASANEVLVYTAANPGAESKRVLGQLAERNSRGAAFLFEERREAENQEGEEGASKGYLEENPEYVVIVADMSEADYQTFRETGALAGVDLRTKDFQLKPDVELARVVDALDARQLSAATVEEYSKRAGEGYRLERRYRNFSADAEGELVAKLDESKTKDLEKQLRDGVTGAEGAPAPSTAETDPLAEARRRQGADEDDEFAGGRGARTEEREQDEGYYERLRRLVRGALEAEPEDPQLERSRMAEKEAEQADRLAQVPESEAEAPAEPTETPPAPGDGSGDLRQKAEGSGGGASSGKTDADPKPGALAEAEEEAEGLADAEEAETPEALDPAGPAERQAEPGLAEDSAQAGEADLDGDSSGGLQALEETAAAVSRATLRQLASERMQKLLYFLDEASREQALPEPEANKRRVMIIIERRADGD